MDITKKEKTKIANAKWREANKEKFREIQKEFYKVNMQNDDWKKHYHERIKRNIDKHKQKKIEDGIIIKSRGRPRKILHEIQIINI